MNQRQLMIFKTLCEEKNFTKTAQKLYMSQPAISHVIRELEDEFNCCLLERNNKYISLTDKGEYLFNKALQILELHDEVYTYFQSQELPTLKIGSSITIANFYLPQFLIQLKQRFPSLNVTINIQSASQIEEQLYHHQIDIAFIEGDLHHDFIAQPFSYYDVVPLCSCYHPFALQETLTLSDLCKEPLLLREKGSASRDLLEQYLLTQHIAMTPTVTSTNSQALIQLAKNNLGITFLPEILVQKELQQGTLVQLNIPHLRLRNQNQIVYHASKEKNRDFQKIFSAITSLL